MEDSGVRVERHGAIANVVLDRPPVNAIASKTYERLMAVLQDVDADSSIDVVLLSSGNARVFCAGADIKELQATVNDSSSRSDEERQRLARETYELLLDLAQPTIAVLNGAAIGAGAVLAACCDIRIASDQAAIGLLEINVARCGGGRHLMRSLPQGVVRRMYFTGDMLEASRAYDLGLFEEVVPLGQELDSALSLANDIASKSPLALRMAKRALNQSESLPVKEGYGVEQRFTVELGRSEDAKEAAAAFLEKRKPNWTGE